VIQPHTAKLPTSFLDTLDPRTRVLITLLFVIPSALTQSIIGVSIALFFALFFTLIAHLTFALIKTRLWALLSFLTLIWITLPFSMPGQIIWSWHHLTLTDTGLQFTQMMSIRITALVIGTTALLGSLSVFDLTHALRHFHLPHKLVMLLFFCFRYVDVIYTEYKRLHRAMNIRGFVAKTSLHTYRSYAYLLGMLLVRSFERSERVYQAMLMRGFTGTFPAYRIFALQSRDILCTGSAIMAVCLSLWIV